MVVWVTNPSAPSPEPRRVTYHVPAGTHRVWTQSAGRMRVQFEQPSPEYSLRRPEPCIWAIGGGKGGVGKSVLTSSLGIALANTGQRCAVVDVDLGGANLHTLLGVPRPARTLSHFVRGEVASLEEILCPTSVRNLSIVSGSSALLEMANVKHAHKEKLLRHVRKLDVDHVLLDLGAGSAFNVLDFFVAARRAVVVVIPEPTSFENAYAA